MNFPTDVGSAQISNGANEYPIPDASHARNAKARASQMEHQGKLSAADKKKVDAKADKILKK